MNKLKKEINNLEFMKLTEDIYIKFGSIPILISVPHSIKQNNKIKPKLNEPILNQLHYI